MVVVIGREYLKVDCGLRLAPRGMYVKNLGAGLECPVNKLSRIVVDDVTYGMPTLGDESSESGVGGGGGEILGMAAEGGVSMPPMSLLLWMRTGRLELYLSGVCGG